MNISLSFILIPRPLREYNRHLMIAVDAAIVLTLGDTVWFLLSHITHTEHQKPTRIPFLCSHFVPQSAPDRKIIQQFNSNAIIDAPQNLIFSLNWVRDNFKIKHFNYTRIWVFLQRNHSFYSITPTKHREIPNSDRSQTLSQCQSFTLNSTLHHITSIEPHTDMKKFKF